MKYILKMLRGILSVVFSRVFLIVLMLLFQVGLIASLIVLFSRSSVYVYIVLQVFSALVALGIVSQDNVVPEQKITWIVFVISFPVVGGIFYLLLGYRRVPKRFQKHIDTTSLDMEEYLPHVGILPTNDYNKLHAQYVEGLSGYPVYNNSAFEYYPLGDDMFVRILEELEKAKTYICLEFFIVKPGRMFDSLLEVLQRKIDQGVDVYFMYDDFGTVFNLPRREKKRLHEMGVQIKVFNPFRPHLSTILNHRDHRKIILIDGKVGFTGGINIADEYINEKERFGHWKDTGVMVKGPAAWAFGIMFFELWNFTDGKVVNISDFEPKSHYQVEADGYVQVFGDTPFDDHNVIEVVYLKAIQQARDYIYIATPYLVIDYAMQEALCTAAQSGVDVRLITPHIYDKWYVHTLTVSHYEHLIENGVKIYEYTPGFLHGKMFVADDRIGVVGTCNMDFRSFYLHFECSVLFFESEILQEVKKDLVNTLEESQRISLEEVKQLPIRTKVLQYLLKIFAPLM